MIEGFYLAILIGTVLVLAASFSSLLASRFGAPLLLVFLCIGLIAGEDGLGIAFDNAPVAYFVGSLALAIILFDSGFGTALQTFRQASAPAITLATLGVLLTAALLAVPARFALGLPWPEALLLGAIVSSTDAAAVFFLLRIGGIHIRDRVRATLEVESGTNDPMAIFLTIMLVELITIGTKGELWVEIVRVLIMQMGIGLLAGFAGGVMIVRLVNRLDMERGLTPIFTLALSLLVFALAGLVEGSGFLAVYVAGLYAGNAQMKAAPTIRRFQEGTTWLAQIIMFLVLGLLATPSQFPSIAPVAILLALALILLARPIAVWLCLLPFNFQRREAAFIAWVGLRGAVSILLAIVPILGGMENGQLFFNIVFLIVLVSLAVQGWTLGPLAHRLGLVVPARIGPVQKVELELPGTAHHELLSYRVVPDSPVARGQRLPRWARPSLVVRDGQSMPYHYAGRLRAGDYVYIFISPRYPRLLDRLFASPASVEGDDADFFGAFAIDPSRPAAELKAAYDAAVTEDEEAMTIGEMMITRLGGRAEIADRLALGPVELIVRDVDEKGRITAVGVSLEPEPPGRELPLFLNLREIMESVRQWLARRRMRQEKSAEGGDAVEQSAAEADTKTGGKRDILRS
jgi:cell volume regulation protein A